MGGTFRDSKGKLDVETLVDDACEFIQFNCLREYLATGLRKKEVEQVVRRLNSDGYDHTIVKEADTRAGIGSYQLRIMRRKS